MSKDNRKRDDIDDEKSKNSKRNNEKEKRKMTVEIKEGLLRSKLPF